MQHPIQNNNAEELNVYYSIQKKNKGNKYLVFLSFLFPTPVQSKLNQEWVHSSSPLSYE